MTSPLLARARLAWDRVSLWVALGLAVATFVVWRLAAKTDQAELEEAVQGAVEAHRAEVERVKAAYEAEREARGRAEEEYRQRMGQIEWEHAAVLAQLDDRAKAQVADLARQYGEDPARAGAELERRFGIRVEP